MADLTREQIGEIVNDLPGDMPTPAQVRALCTMALRAIDTGWQPMETAPRDGTRVWVTYEINGHRWRGEAEGHWLHADWCAIAWMPLPPPFTGDTKTLGGDDA